MLVQIKRDFPENAKRLNEKTAFIVNVRSNLFIQT